MSPRRLLGGFGWCHERQRRALVRPGITSRRFVPATCPRSGRCCRKWRPTSDLGRRSAGIRRGWNERSTHQERERDHVTRRRPLHFWSFDFDDAFERLQLPRRRHGRRQVPRRQLASTIARAAFPFCSLDRVSLHRCSKVPEGGGWESERGNKTTSGKKKIPSHQKSLG